MHQNNQINFLPACNKKITNKICGFALREDDFPQCLNHFGGHRQPTTFSAVLLLKRSVDSFYMKHNIIFYKEKQNHMLFLSYGFLFQV